MNDIEKGWVNLFGKKASDTGGAARPDRGLAPIRSAIA